MSNAPDVQRLFTDARLKGVISAESYDTLTAVDLGDRIQDALGTPADQIESSEAFLLAHCIDDSTSIRMAGNTQNIRDGHNLVLEALRASKSQQDILVYAVLLNGGVLLPFTPLANAETLTSQNYNPNGNTPLYDRAVETLGTVLAKERELASQGIPVRTVTLIMTDGQDVGSRRTAADVATIVRDMLKRENHLIAGMGVDNGETDFVHVFQEMGLDPAWILTPKNDPKEIRKAFQVFSRSSVQASQGAGNFTALQGFTT